jgi:hypothetical protein
VATKKQKRRREKERRHEYEYVYVDDDGREVEVEEAERERKNGKSSAQQRSVRTGRGRTVDPPSWRRTLRRAAIFTPLMFVILYLLRPNGAGAGSVVFSVALLMVFFIPFSYFMDTLMFRFAQRRAEKARGSSAKGSSGRS